PSSETPSWLVSCQASGFSSGTAPRWSPEADSGPPTRPRPARYLSRTASRGTPLSPFRDPSPTGQIVAMTTIWAFSMGVRRATRGVCLLAVTPGGVAGPLACGLLLAPGHERHVLWRQARLSRCAAYLSQAPAVVGADRGALRHAVRADARG